MKVVAIIPARHGSQRFPGKPLALLKGEPIIKWVVRRARDVEAISEIYVATDNIDIAKAAGEAGATALMPEGDFVSGTDRIAAAAEGMDADIIVNIQGDEPQIKRETIKRAIHAVVNDPSVHVGTACVKIYNKDEYLSPNVVKVVRDRFDYAMYFSRSPIPNLSRSAHGALQNFELVPTDTDADGQGRMFYGWRHIGLYVYRRNVLEEFVSLMPTLLEDTEKLEQMRLMENGYRIAVPETPHDCRGVDTPEDLKALEAEWEY